MSAASDIAPAWEVGLTARTSSAGASRPAAVRTLRPAARQPATRQHARAVPLAGHGRLPGRAVPLASHGRLPAVVLATVALLALGVALWLGGAGSAQAAGRGRPYQGMTRIVVRPGQTLWGIATAAEPTADTFGVIQQIVKVNRLPGTTIEAGEVLWVPK